MSHNIASNIAPRVTSFFFKKQKSNKTIERNKNRTRSFVADYSSSQKHNHHQSFDFVPPSVVTTGRHRLCCRRPTMNLSS